MNKQLCRCYSNSYGWNTHIGCTGTSEPGFLENLEFNIGHETTIMFTFFILTWTPSQKIWEQSVMNMGKDFIETSLKSKRGTKVSGL